MKLPVIYVGYEEVGKNVTLLNLARHPTIKALGDKSINFQAFHAYADINELAFIMAQKNCRQAQRQRKDHG